MKQKYRVMKLRELDKFGEILENISIEENKVFMVYEDFNLEKPPIGKSVNVYIDNDYLYCEVEFNKDINLNKYITIAGEYSESDISIEGDIKYIKNFELHCLSLVDNTAFENSERIISYNKDNMNKD